MSKNIPASKKNGRRRHKNQVPLPHTIGRETLTSFSIAAQVKSESLRRYNLLGFALSALQIQWKRNVVLAKNEVWPEDLRVYINKRQKETGIPVLVLFMWKKLYDKGGIQALEPNGWEAIWESWSEEVQLDVMNIGFAIKPLADQESIDEDDVLALAKQLGWTQRTLERWIKRYRVGGLIGLGPGQDPERKKKTRVKQSGPIGWIQTEEDLERVIKGRSNLGDLAELDHVSNERIKNRAAEVGVAPRTLRQQWSDFKHYGNAGFVRKERDDKGKRHNISELMVNIIIGLRLSKKDASVNWVYQQALKRAYMLEELPPEPWTVRDIINTIPEAVRLIADGRYDQFRNKYRMTHPWISEEGINPVTYYLDWTRVPVLVIDQRNLSEKDKKEQKSRHEVRPFIINCVGYSVSVGLFL